MLPKVEDKVRIKDVGPVAKAWCGREGKVVGIYGEIPPFHFEVEIVIGECRPKYLLFKGDELEVLK